MNVNANLPFLSLPPLGLTLIFPTLSRLAYLPTYLGYQTTDTSH